ncbi:MAG: hypothetical protein ACKO8S_01855 [Actinomycetota bacterium]
MSKSIDKTTKQHNANVQKGESSSVENMVQYCALIESAEHANTRKELADGKVAAISATVPTIGGILFLCCHC